MAIDIDGFTRTDVTHEGQTYPVYRRGKGPGVVVIHEIPGLTPEVISFANRVARSGFTVVMPSLFGTPKKPMTGGYILTSMTRACVSREFLVLASHKSSPITNWLRWLAGELHKELGGKGVGAIGMCLTGNFALAMAVDDALLAPVLSQPSLPFPIGAERCRSLHVSDEALATIKARAAKGLKVLGLRFTHDPAVPQPRFDRLRAELGDGFEAIEIDSSPGNDHGIPTTSHSVLTKDFINEEGHPTRLAMDRVMAFFHEKLD